MPDKIVGPLLPVAFVIAVGFLAGKRGKLSHSDSLLITRLVLNWIFPALLLVGMASTSRSQLLDYRLIAATFIGLMGMYAIGIAIGWLRFRELKAATLKGFVCGYPDAAFMGIPILQAMFGPSSLYSILVLNVIASLVMIPLTTVHPALMFAATVILAVKGIYAQQMILLCALPSATMTAMFANDAGVYQSEAATSVLVDTALSIVTFSFVIYLINGGLAAA
jgi:predicted permease